MNRIRELRERRGIQQKELAIDLAVSQPTISDWESGRKVPSAKSTLKLSKYFGVTVEYLMGEDVATRPATDEEIRFALFGGDAKEISDAQYQEVLRFAQYIKARDKK